MPGLDGTGPRGQGSQTGRRQGKCQRRKGYSAQEMSGGRGHMLATDSENNQQGNSENGRGRGNRKRMRQF